jgi:hypothetical protein
MHLFLVVTAAQKRHLQEIGILIAGIGAVAVFLSGLFGLRSMSRVVERATMMVAGVLLTVGFIIELYGLHAK